MSTAQKAEVDTIYQKAEQMEDGSVTSDFDPDSPEIRRVRRKADLHLIPIFSLLYLFSFIDRVNIGNAKVAGIEKALGITSTQFNMALTVFFIGYILFEIPSNIMLKLLGPKIWISLVIVVWGGVMMSMSSVTNAGSLYAARFFLGVAEAGLLPGVIYLISVWYTKREMALRNGLFFSMASFSGAFSGILAYGISKLHGKAGFEGWQWIFLLEGLFTICLVPLAFFGLPQSPANAWFLTPEERELQVTRLRKDAGPAKEEHFSFKQLKMAVTDWQVYMYIIGYFMGSAPLFALSLFIPSIVHSFKYDAVVTQIMTAPAFFCAALTCLTCAILSDRFNARAIFCIIPTWVGSLGYILLIVCRDQSPAVRYVCLTITTCGVFSSAPAMFSWFSSNFGGHTKKAVAIGMIVSIGCIGGVLATAQKMPHSTSVATPSRPHSRSQLRFLYIRENRRRDNLTPEEHAKEAQGEELCDRHPDFRYSY
ncbi:hypothetical protein BGZ73_007748 [Actinomortierella ambigua]|nr:hypothetical protein BGZ73_007748 [Actinomortierella ambigua]